MNNVQIYCKDFDGTETNTYVADGSQWGNWLDDKSCPANSYVCGVNARVEDPQGKGDDTSVNELEFYCCSDTSHTSW